MWSPVRADWPAGQGPRRPGFVHSLLAHMHSSLWSCARLLSSVCTMCIFLLFTLAALAAIAGLSAAIPQTWYVSTGRIGLPATRPTDMAAAFSATAAASIESESVGSSEPVQSFESPAPAAPATTFISSFVPVASISPSSAISPVPALSAVEPSFPPPSVESFYSQSVRPATPFSTPPTPMPSASPVPLSTLKTPLNTTAPFSLRIMALGASVSYGVGSADGNGYRAGLRAHLRHSGWPVDMVGDVHGGWMRDSATESHPGHRVDELRFRWANASITHWQPNFVLINAGTNDALQRFRLDGAGARMGQLLDTIWDAMPTAVVVLSTLLPEPDTLNPAGVESINTQYRALAAELQKAGRHVVLAELDDGWIRVEDLVDGMHPTAVGYARVAARFVQGIDLAYRAGWAVASPLDRVDGQNSTEKNERDDYDPSFDPALPAPPDDGDTAVLHPV